MGDLSKPSRFISLEPCGLAEGPIESLTGYVHRLADAHGLATRGIVIREFAPRFTRPLVDDEGHSDLFGPFGSALNGLAHTAQEAVAILSELTGRDNLAALTLLPFRGTISPRSSVRKTAAWCPACLSDWFSHRRTIYQPLIWQLDVVSVCPFHNSRLEQCCPQCSKTHFQMARNSVLGCCPRCGAWLGIESLKGCRREATASRLDRAIALQIHRLIQSVANHTIHPRATLLQRNLRLILNQKFGGSVTAFSRAAGMHHNSVSELVSGDSRPGLDSLLRLAMASGLEPTRLLGERISPSEFLISSSAHSTSSAFERRTCRKYDWPSISRTVQLELDESQHRFPQSLFSLCRPHALDSGYVGRQLKESTDVLVGRYQRAAASRRRTRESDERLDLRRAVRFCLEHRLWPSNRRLRTLVKAPGSLRNPGLERERRQAIAGEFQRFGSKGPNFH